MPLTLRRSALLAATLALAFLALPGPALARPADAPLAADGSPALYDDRVVVVIDRGTTAGELSELLAEEGVPSKRRGSSVRSYVVRTPKGRDPRKLAEKLRREPGVAYAEPNYRVSATWVPNDIYYPRQWGLPMVGAPAAWDITRGSGVVVAVIDTGADFLHPDLAGRLDSARDKDFVNGDSSAQDDNGHGTHVSGIIAATTGNGLGVAGMAPQSTVLPLKVLDASGDGSTIDVGDAIRYAVDNGAGVLNLSLEASGYSSYLAEALAHASRNDVVVAASSGNGGAPQVGFPARWYGVIGVGAVGPSKARASYSSYGDGLDLVAPGGTAGIAEDNIYSTYRGGYAYLAGTSMSAPHVAGAAALVRAYHPAWPAGYVSYALTSTSEDLGAADWDPQYGWGLIAADSALLASVPGDALEPDNVTAEARPLAVGGAQDHTYLPVGERDLAVIDTEFGRRYRVWTSGLSSGCDTHLEVRDAAGNVLAANDDVAPSDLSSAVEFNGPSSGKAYVYSLDLWETGGSYRLSASSPNVEGTSIPVLGVSDGSVAYGGVSTISATLYDSAMSPLTGDRIAILQRSRDNADWEDLQTLSSGTGVFSATVRTYRRTYYRFAYGGDATHQGSTSPSRAVTARVWVTRPYAPPSVRVRRYFSAYGYLMPRHTAGRKPVHIETYRWTGSRWSLQANRYAAASDHSAYTKYGRRMALPCRGRWKLRTHHLFDRANDATRSTWTYVRVY